MSYGVGCSRGSDPMMLWLWCRPTATALIRPLAGELPYATNVALKEKKKKSHTLPPRSFGTWSPCCQEAQAAWGEAHMAKN